MLQAMAAKLHQDANELLINKNIADELAKYGEVIFTGSFALDLMVWPDIDIQVVIDPKTYDRVKVFTDLAYKYLQDQDVKNVKLINFTPGKKPGMPQGMYIGMNCNYKDRTWKIDIWALDQQFQVASTTYMQEVQSKLTQELRTFILKWKHKLLCNGRVPQLGSYTLYKAILFEGLVDDEQIKQYLLANGVKI